MPVLEKTKTYRNGRINTFALFLPEIKEALLNKSFLQLKDILKKIHSIDIAENWNKLEAQEKILLFRLLTIRKAIEVFEDLNFKEQSFLLNNLGNAEIAPILNDMASDERANLFKELPQRVSKKLFSVMKKEEIDDLRILLNFEKGTAGSLMTTEFVELKKDMTARRAILVLQEKQKADSAKRTIYSVFVTDEEHKLLGGVSLQILIMAPPDMLVKDLFEDVESIKINMNMPEKEVARQFSKYDLLDAPVVNDQSQLIGIITIDDVVDLIQAESTKEIYEIGKMEAAGGKEIRYATTTVRELIKRRAGWLIVLLAFDFLTGTVLKTFEHALSSVVALTFFIPMLLDTGGNAGNQTAITIIRGFATGDVDFKNVWKVVRLEVMAALFMGVIVGSVAFIRALMLQQDVSVSLVVGFTMTAVVLLAILTGIALPLFSKKIGLDPAVLAGPITTSVVDVVGLIIYFKIAQLIIPVLR
ncbi:MAG: magnesium transporter [Candidatus Omnitrophota bacterium]